MVGVEAISGGLTAVLLLLGVALLGVFALAAGRVLWVRKRRMFAGVAASFSLALLLSVAWVIWRAFPPPIPTLSLDAGALVGQIRASPFECRVLGEDEWCSVSRSIEVLQLKLPGGASRHFSATSLYVVSKSGTPLVAAFMPGRMSKSELLTLLDIESKESSAAAPDVDSLRRRVNADDVVRADQHAFFQRPGYAVHIWVLPRHTGADHYALWYEVQLWS